MGKINFKKGPQRRKKGGLKFKGKKERNFGKGEGTPKGLKGKFGKLKELV